MNIPIVPTIAKWLKQHVALQACSHHSTLTSGIVSCVALALCHALALCPVLALRLVLPPRACVGHLRSVLACCVIFGVFGSHHHHQWSMAPAVTAAAAIVTAAAAIVTVAAAVLCRSLQSKDPAPIMQHAHA